MPITTRYPLRKLTEEQFKSIDYPLMGAAFKTHNRLGRLFSETSYKHEMCDRIGLRCDLEEAILVSYKNFSKTFLMDVVVEHGLICELKACQAITPKHEAQLLQYMLLCEATRGKIINFGGTSVEGNLLSTTLTHSKRKELNFNYQEYQNSSIEAQAFREVFVGFLKDIGGFLSLSLYYEGITCLMGGSEKIVQSIDVLGASKAIATQKCHMLNSTSAFKITALTANSDIELYRQQLKKFLNCTNLNEVHWVNLNHHDITFETVFWQSTSMELAD